MAKDAIGENGKLSVWRLLEWNPMERTYLPAEPEGMQRVFFASRAWYDARNMALCYFGRDIPNEAKWTNEEYVYAEGNSLVEGPHVLVKHLDTGIEVEMFPKPAPDLSLPPPSSNGEGTAIDLLETTDDDDIPF